MRLTICNEMFEKWPWERVTAFCAELGYQGLEVAPYTLAARPTDVSDEQRRELRRTAERAGVPVVATHWLLARTEGLYLTHPDSAVRRRTSLYLVDLIRLTADLGGKVMVFGSPKQRNLIPGISRERALTYARDVFEPTLAEAERSGVTFGFEPLSPVETDFINTAEEGIELVETLRHPRFRLNLDVKAMSGSEKKPLPEVLRAAAPHLVHVQVNDPNLLGPGMGDVDHRPIVRTLREIGYTGCLSVEAFDYSPGPEHIARESIRYLRRVLGGG